MLKFCVKERGRYVCIGVGYYWYYNEVRNNKFYVSKVIYFINVVID